MRKIIAILLAFMVITASAFASEALLQLTPEPQLASIGGEWTIIALARSGYPVPDGYYEGYLDRAEAALEACGGVLHQIKRTEYSRVALALAALGEGPSDFRGYDLLTPLTETDMVKIQGNNGPIWALIALDSNDYAGVEEAREKLITEIVAQQNSDGGYGIAPGQASDTDMTAMALTALVKHSDADGASACIDAALNFLAAAEYDSSESCAQTLVAYSALNMQEEAADVRAMLEEYAIDGGYRHLMDEQAINGMATEQAGYGAAAGTMLLCSLMWFLTISETFTGEKWMYMLGKLVPALSLILSLIFRFVPKLIRQFKQINDALALSEVDQSKLKRAFHTFSAVISWALEDAAETADSMRCRGYGLPGRTAYNRYRFDLRDLFMLAAVVALSAGMFAFVPRYYYFPVMYAESFSPGICCLALLCLLPSMTGWVTELRYLSRLRRTRHESAGNQ